MTIEEARSLRHFARYEFACPCCGSVQFDYRAARLLDAAREIACVPFVVNSAYRCPAHNESVGGSSTSSHLRGLAVDLKAPDGATAWTIASGLVRVGFERIGVYASHIHADLDPDKPARVLFHGVSK